MDRFHHSEPNQMNYIQVAIISKTDSSMLTRLDVSYDHVVLYNYYCSYSFSQPNETHIILLGGVTIFQPIKHCTHTLTKLT